jgi:methylated-DNA-protein-cysteine methyltransferase-like protein
MIDTFHQRAIQVIKKIPQGKVATYGQVASLAGKPRGARMVVRVLNSAWKKDKLPWHRVINREGKISLKKGQGFEIQLGLLKGEGVKFETDNTIDLEKFGWRPHIRSV